MLLAILLAVSPSQSALLLRVDTGFGWYGASMDSPDLRYSAAGTSFSITAGKVVAENLALHGAIFGAGGFGRPPCHLTVDTCPAAGQQFGALGFGGSYFLPGGFYLTGTAGVGEMLIVGHILGGTSASTGFAGRAGLGRDWRLSQRWNLGLAAQVMAVTGGSFSAVTPQLALSVAYY